MSVINLNLETITLPTAAQAALSVRSAEYITSDSQSGALLVGHCAVKGTISETHPDAVFNFYVGPDPEPTSHSYSVLMLGIYNITEYSKSNLFKRTRSGLSDSFYQLSQKVIGCSEQLNSGLVPRNCIVGARRAWQELIANDLLTDNGSRRKQYDLLSPDNLPTTSEAAFMYASRSNNRYSRCAQFIADQAWRISGLKTTKK
ncbi:MAG: hypothetical protein M3Q14_02420 [bacterium]|nr:hypothetical protein [bacterium]